MNMSLKEAVCMFHVCRGTGSSRRSGSSDASTASAVGTTRSPAGRIVSSKRLADQQGEGAPQGDRAAAGANPPGVPLPPTYSTLLP